MATIVDPRTFASLAQWRAWLKKNHAAEPTLWVLLAKKHVAEPKLSYVDLVEEGLCWGWIDGLVNSWDDDYRAIRMTQRLPRSLWSASNVIRVEKLKKEGRMQPAGQKLIDLAKEKGTWADGERKKDPNRPAHPFLVAALKVKTNARAREGWDAWPASQRLLVIDWIDRAVQDETKQRRVEKVLVACANGDKIF